MDHVGDFGGVCVRKEEEERLAYSKQGYLLPTAISDSGIDSTWLIATGHKDLLILANNKSNYMSSMPF
jgi:hypothetical protein